MSEQEFQIENAKGFGRESIERGQGFEPMPETPRPETETAEPFAKAYEGGNDWRNSDQEQQEPPPVQYNKRNADGTPSNEKSPENQSVTPERAARDLADYRRQQANVDAALKDAEFAAQIEAAKSPLAAEAKRAAEGTWQRSQADIDALPVHEQQAYYEEQARLAEQQRAQEAQAQQQPEAQPADHDLSRVLQENPRLMEAIQQQRQADWAGANQTIQAAEQWIQASAAQATAGVFVAFPELQNVSLQELPIALNLMQRQNPERHAQVMHHINSIQVMLEQSRFVQQQQQQRAAQQYQHEWSQWSADEDAKFVRAVPEAANPAKATEIAGRARAYLHNIGLNDSDIGQIWNGSASISLRDSRAQRILYDAMRYREAQAAVPRARNNAPPRVQKPGPSGQIATAEDVDLRNLSNKLANARGNEAARLGAQMIAERRARSRGR